MNQKSMAAKKGKIKIENIKKNALGLFCAVAYYYRCIPTGLFYCGATIDESTRKSAFKSIKNSYGGKKIDSARQSYPDISKQWEYKPIPIVSASVDELLEQMDYLEHYLISYYDSYRNGYNSNPGGSGRGSKSRVLVILKDGTQRIFNSCEDVAREYTMSPGNVYHYVYMLEGHRKRNGMIFLPIDDNTTMSALPPDFFTTYSITLP